MRAKWKITIAVSWIIFLACLHTIAFGDDHDMIFEELDSDIKQFRQVQSKILDDLINLRIDVAHVTAHQHEKQDLRLRSLENDLERLHGASTIMMWIVSIIGLLTAPIAIAGVKRISKNVMEKANGS
jgi:hypothetical protein